MSTQGAKLAHSSISLKTADQKVLEISTNSSRLYLIVLDIIG